MASIRPGNKTVFLVVDFQVDVVREAWDSQRIVGNIAHAVDRARAAGVPVVWVQHEADDLVRDSAGWQWAPPLAPADGETRIYKQFNSSFEDTPLDAELARLGATHVVLAGAATNWCIRATAYGALDRGYDLTLVSDAHTTKPMEFEDGTVILADTIVRELNIAMKWLEYPGRRNAAVVAEEVVFG